MMKQNPVAAVGLSRDRKVNILIVDDLPEKHVVMESILEELGQNIVTARSGREALKLILQMEFAVILLDVNMPDIDGLETAGLIRQYRKTAQTPIVFITSYVDEAQAARGYALGAVDYISSPVVPGILRSKVRVFVQLHQMNMQLQMQVAEREALARSEAARNAAEVAIQRADYLSGVSQRLAVSLDLDDTVDVLAEIAVPALGLAAAVAMLDSHGDIHCRSLRIAADGSASGQVPRAPGRIELDSKVTGALRSAMRARTIAFLQPELVTGVLSAFGLSSTGAGPGTGISKVAVCPLFAGEHLLGALVLFGDASHFQSTQVALMTEVVSRASIAMENARLYTLVQEADRRKNEFLAMLAHELRNPLAPIRNAVRIIHGVPEVDEKVSWARDVIGRQVDHMSRMVDDLLDVSRIVRGKVTVQAEPLLLSALCERAVEASSPFITARQQAFHISLPEEIVVVHGDIVRLSQVLSNLLNNASKFTPAEGVISLSAAMEGDTLKLVVSDNGQGIEPQFLPHVFDLFAQGDQTLDRSQGGLGIGLTLVKHLVELHEGEVAVYSDGRGTGTQIVLRFPAKVVQDAPAAGPESGRPAQVGATSRRVLVVDDLVASADTMKMLLEMEGFEVQVAHDGLSALAIAREFVPEVVILDIGLPGMDGFEIARRLRASDESRDALLIALTGYGEAESRLRSREAGFDHHVVKPADLDFLLSIVGQAPVPALAALT